MKTRAIIEYLLAAALVLILGSLTGWYFSLRARTETTAAESAARGFGISIPEGRANGDIPAFAPRSGTAAARPTERPAQLWKAEEKPTAGHLFIGTGSMLRLRYVDRSAGYVFDADPATGSHTRLTNTLMPKIYEAQLSENGRVVERSVDALGNITTFAGTVSTSTDTTSASSSAMTFLGSYLPNNISNVAMHPVSGTLLYTIAETSGRAVVSSDWDGQKPKTLFRSVILHWRPAVLEDGRTFIAQTAADGIAGYGYELKKDGVLNRILGPLPGLVMRVRPSSKSEIDALLWSQSIPGDLRLFVRVGQSATPVQLPVRTSADKCAWLPGKDLIAYCGVPQGRAGQNFLDTWYRGAAHSSDALWRIDASAGTAELIYTPPSNTPIDIEDITADRDGGFLAFRNGADKSLWLFRLSN